MKSPIQFAGIIVVAGLLLGCSSAPSDMTPQEVEALKHPSKGMTKEAAEGMKHMGEMMQKQKEQNEKDGVDSRGIKIDKSKAPASNAPPSGSSGDSNSSSN